MKEFVIMEEIFDVAVLGATALGCGIAFEGGGRTILIDEGVTLCADYTRTLRPMTLKGSGLLADELRKRGLVGRGVSTPALDGIMCGLLKDSGAKLLLCCRPASIDRAGGHFEVEYFGVNGFRKIIARNVIDTRAHSGKVRFNLICARIFGDIRLEHCEGFEVSPGGFEEEAFLTLPDGSLTDALGRFYSGASVLPEGWKIAAAAQETDLRGLTGISRRDGVIFDQSAAYEDADIAFEEGRKCFTDVLKIV